MKLRELEGHIEGGVEGRGDKVLRMRGGKQEESWRKDENERKEKRSGMKEGRSRRG